MSIDPTSRFDHQEILRYSRHLILPEVGAEGQARIKDGRVLVVGAGGLGSPAAMYLAAAGVGTLGLVDFDDVELSNLQRQIMHATAAIGGSKLRSAADRLEQVNPHVQLELFETRLTSANALEILDSFDVVIDGSDNFPTRYLVNDACVLLGIANVYGAIFRFDGQASVFQVGKGPCYRCLFRDPPPPGSVPSCAEGGVLGALPGIVGSVQALEALKLLLGTGETLVGRLLLVDSLRMRFRELALRRDAGCPMCGDEPTITELQDYEAFCGTVSTDAASEADEISVTDLADRLRDDGDIQLIDVREPLEWEICRLEGSRLIPLGQLPARLAEVDGHREVVTVCHYGVRSIQALEVLRAAGFGSVRNLKGGLEAWSREVDPTMPRY